VDWLLRQRFEVLLLALAGLIVVYPWLHEPGSGRLLFGVVRTLSFLAAFLVLFPSRPLRLVAAALGAPTIVGNWTEYALPGLPDLPVAVAFHGCAALFFAFTIATVLHGIYRAGTVTAESIYGALAAYLLVALAFSHLYCVVEAAHPGSFRGSEELTRQLQDRSSRHFVLTYFSLITLTTLGYGDIAPASGPARGLAALEAILGQFYIAVLLAELVGKRAAQGRPAPPADPGA
jgi:hypothetical protein